VKRRSEGDAGTVALVTLALGPRYLARWRAYAEPAWRRYAARHGYDLICIDQPLDTSPRARGRSPAWQKLLVLEQPFAGRYERVVWVDADVVINPAAPPVAAGIPVERVGAVDEFATPTPALYRRALLRLYTAWEARGVDFVRNETPADYYRAYGLPARFEQVVQTGVLVLSPSHHRELLRSTYDRYEDRGPALNYEMRPLSYELLDADRVEWLDPRFNVPWLVYAALNAPELLERPRDARLGVYVQRALAAVHFLHFSGDSDAIAAVDPGEQQPRRRARARPLQTPVVLLIHARPEPTRHLAAAVRAANPARLLVVADGPKPGTEALCEAARRAVEAVDWDCEVATSYATENLGLKRRVETGLEWAFSLVEEAIVLEDDCLPHPSFFRFCDELVDRYRDQPSVTAISGASFDSGARALGASYRFSRYPLIWGWATWRRAWQLYDPELSQWPELRDSDWLERFLGDEEATQYWSYIFERTYRTGYSWDYAFVLASWLAGGLSVLPARNLVTNVGFGAAATNTRAEHRGIFADVPAVAIDFPLRHPPAVERDVAADEFLESVMFSGNVGRLFDRLRAHRAEQRHAFRR
jgi:hypothetical protein